jgi:predicted amidohydrolase/GNAT superfamily N-acetyltransferase
VERVIIRQATLNDVDAIVDLNDLVYPAPEEEDVRWTARHLEAHLRQFAEGQFVADLDGRVVGSSSALIVSLGRDPYRSHTWSGLTDSGMFYNHDPFGDTLYGADTVVHPDFRRRGIGHRLYEARKDLARRLNLRRIILGGRLMDYVEKADEMSPEEYARRVEDGECVDPVLSFQLKEGYSLHQVMPNYVKDPRSLDNATFLEWLNPDFQPRYRRSARSIRVTAVQYQMRRISDFDGFATQISYFVDVAKAYGSDYVVFPELLTAQLMSFIDVKTAKEAIRRLTTFTEELDKLFVDLAKEYQICIVGGSHPTQVGDHIENICSLYLPSGEVFQQPKLHITPNERRSWGIEGGRTLRVFDTPKAKVGILICYDSEFPEAARYLSDEGAEVIFVPFCTDDRQAYLRVRYCCQARAIENQVYVVMAGTVGNLPDVDNMDIQYAQSAVLSPSDFSFSRDGIVAEASVNSEMVITTDLDLEALEEAINSGSVRQRRDRRPDLFSLSVSLPDERS